MEKMRKGTWEDVIRKAAMEAARERVKYNVKNKYGRSDGDEKKYFEKYLRQLEKELPYETASNEDIELITGFGAEPLFKWFDFGGISPRDNAKRIEASKILPYLTGVAKEGEDWMSLPRGKMDELAVSMGYKPGDPEERGAFYDKIRQYQTDLDRARIAKEMQDSPEHLAMSLAWPALTEGIDNAVATGGDLSMGQVAGLSVADVLANSAIMAIPGLRTGLAGKGAGDNIFRGSRAVFEFTPTSKDLLNAVLQGAAQGGAEMGRQIAKNKIDDELAVDYAAPIAAGTLGATTPGIVGIGSGIASKFGPTGREIARGINKTVRSQNPMFVERQNLANTVNAYNRLAKDISEMRKLAKAAAAERKVEVVLPRELAETERILSAQKFPKTAEILGIKPDENGMYSTIEALNAYDRPIGNFLELGNDNYLRKVDVPGNTGVRILGPGNEEQFAGAFPARIADLKERTPNIETGMFIGNVLQDLGSRIEPTIKGSVNAIKSPSYKDSPWYKKLDPERRRIIDEAYKKKQDEE